ncbi:hypothetical protein PV08_07233 [Exophiala spinifera]|uniref:Transmembrane protein n=1 Tax=Exophiala spinifera TaxID=91928 RepID=A0A0D2BT79_9EURO|nr:uncharacterized protein PV08_07233 [Exophiala spinifera]KIW14449.1 hypothetical protein PV08_07233 [Exophiala spinifera]
MAKTRLDYGWLALWLLFTYSPGVSAQDGDGGAASGVEPGDVGGGSPGTGTGNAGAQGSDTGSVKLSTGATVAIALVVSLVVILGGTTAVLFFLAKKRQWKIKEGLRKSASKVKNAVKAVTTPITPKRMTFSPIEKKKMPTARMERTTPCTRKGLGIRAVDQDRERDLEKGTSVAKVAPVPLGRGDSSDTGESATVKSGERKRGDVGTDSDRKNGKTEDNVRTGGKERSRSRPRPPMVNIPPSAFEIESPKTPMWKKVFGR